MIRTTLTRFTLACGLAAGMSVSLAGIAAAQSTEPHPGPVQQRIDKQDSRIEQGVNSGKLSPQEAAKLQKRDAQIEADRQRDLAAHNGHLTAHERENLNHKLNKTSHKIEHEKHVPN